MDRKTWMVPPQDRDARPASPVPAATPETAAAPGDSLDASFSKTCRPVGPFQSTYGSRRRYPPRVRKRGAPCRMTRIRGGTLGVAPNDTRQVCAGKHPTPAAVPERTLRLDCHAILGPGGAIATARPDFEAGRSSSR